MIKLKVTKKSVSVVQLNDSIKQNLGVFYLSKIPHSESMSLSAEDASRILLWASSTTRFSWFLKIKSICKGEAYWKTLSFAYTCSDNLCDYHKEIKLAFQSKEANRNCLMKTIELEFLKQLPDQLTIYRGMTVEEYESGNWGVSWTLNRDTATFFCDMYDRNYRDKDKHKMVHAVTIDKCKAIAYLNDREEQEIIYVNQ